MEFIIIAFLVAALIFVGVRKLWESTTHKLPTAGPQQMLFMGTALDVKDELIHSLRSKMALRSLEIAKADGRFLVTPADMKQAYEEIIREEHM